MHFGSAYTLGTACSTYIGALEMHYTQVMREYHICGLREGGCYSAASLFQTLGTGPNVLISEVVIFQRCFCTHLYGVGAVGKIPAI